MLEVVRYTKEKKQEWDEFVSKAKNGTFLFYRDYMEYHEDRFEDYSLVVHSKNTPVALFPANIVGNNIYSHQGLTFGGLILPYKYHYENILKYIRSINTFLIENNISSCDIKIPPYFYSNNLAQELNLLLQRNLLKTQKTVLGISINTNNYSFPKKCVKKNKLELYDINFDYQLEKYWQILESNLKDRHNSKPVHTIKEISKLKSLFPNNIKLLSLTNKNNSNTEAGALLYLFNNVCKVQYFATSIEGRTNRASDVLYYSIINYYKDRVQFIDFGTCEEGDNDINIQLLETKEKFGANSFPIYTHNFSTNQTLSL